MLINVLTPVQQGKKNKTSLLFRLVKFIWGYQNLPEGRQKIFKFCEPLGCHARFHSNETIWISSFTKQCPQVLIATVIWFPAKSACSFLAKLPVLASPSYPISFLHKKHIFFPKCYLFSSHSSRSNQCDGDIGCLRIAAPQWMCFASWTPSVCGSSRMWDNPLKLRHSVKRVNDKQWGCSVMKFVGLRASTFLDAERDSHPVKGSPPPLPVNSAGAMTLEFNFRRKKKRKKKKRSRKKGEECFSFGCWGFQHLRRKCSLGKSGTTWLLDRRPGGWIKKKKKMFF